MKPLTFTYFTIIIVSYMIICGSLFLFQESLIFFPTKLPKDFEFGFNQKFEEIDIITHDNVILNSILFKSENPRGLVFYLQGNAGSLNSWGEVAKTYTGFNYDVFMMDYRGYGKSGGQISGQDQLFQDTQAAYDKIKTNYDENEIIIIGYSIGAGLATKLASANNPKLLILQAPFFSLTDMMKQRFPFVPTFLLKYKLETNKYIQECPMPIVIFHGKEDEIIPYKSSLRLKELIKKSDRLIILNNQGHNGMTYNPEYVKEIEKILNQY